MGISLFKNGHILLFKKVKSSYINLSKGFSYKSWDT
jgi:hypothetical protein